MIQSTAREFFFVLAGFFVAMPLKESEITYTWFPMEFFYERNLCGQFALYRN